MKPTNIKIIHINIESLKVDERDAIENIIEAGELIRNCKRSFGNTFFMGPEQLN